MEADQIIIRHPRAEDGLPLYELIKSCPPLDCNTAYCYHLLVRHYPKTCAVAEYDGRLIGALTAYRLPEDPQTLFLWQVAVSKEARGQGIGVKLLDFVSSQNQDCHTLHTTIGPDNAPSRRLLQKWAESKGADYAYEAFLAVDECGPGHDAEELLRIGPIKAAVT